MYRKYHINWLLIMSAIMIISTSLLGQYDLGRAKWWYFLDHGFKIFVPMAGCWLIQGYFLTTQFKSFSGYPKHLLSILTGTFALLVLGFVLGLMRPENYLYTTEVGYRKASDIYIHLGGNTFLSLICYFVFSNRRTSAALEISRSEISLLEHEHLSAQLISLQQQISPHFLFNSLGTLKTMVSDDIARQYIVELARVYRYVLSVNEQYLSRLEDELKFIGSYLHILQERFQDALQVRIDVWEEHYPLSLPSLTLQLLIENAIKHNVCSPGSPLLITITSNGNDALTVENNFQPKRARAGSGGTGLKNIIARYKLMGNKSVEVANHEKKFTVKIPLLNHEGNYNRR